MPGRRFLTVSDALSLLAAGRGTSGGNATRDRSRTILAKVLSRRRTACPTQGNPWYPLVRSSATFVTSTFEELALHHDSRDSNVINVLRRHLGARIRRLQVGGGAELPSCANKWRSDGIAARSCATSCPPLVPEAGKSIRTTRQGTRTARSVPTRSQRAESIGEPHGNRARQAPDPRRGRLETPCRVVRYSNRTFGRTSQQRSRDIR